MNKGLFLQKLHECTDSDQLIDLRNSYRQFCVENDTNQYENLFALDRSAAINAKNLIKKKLVTKEFYNWSNKVFTDPCCSHKPSKLSKNATKFFDTLTWINKNILSEFFDFIKSILTFMKNILSDGNILGFILIFGIPIGLIVLRLISLSK